MKKWGGVFIVISALLPFPYAIVCTVCGMTNYSRKRLLLLGLTRIARFLIYAVFLYRMFNFEAY
jgi:membrane protein YqaA with SNARE-associated domain